MLRPKEAPFCSLAPVLCGLSQGPCLLGVRGRLPNLGMAAQSPARSGSADCSGPRPQSPTLVLAWGLPSLVHTLRTQGSSHQGWAVS